MMTFVRRLWRDRSAIAASEFALILPVLLALLFAVIESGQLMLLDRKVTAAVQTAADIVAQDNDFTDSEVTDLWRGLDNILLPYISADARYRLSSVALDGGGNAIVRWSVGRGLGAHANGTVYPLPAGLLALGGSVIVADVQYTYRPLFVGEIFTGPLEVSDRAYLKPRTTSQVLRNGS